MRRSACCLVRTGHSSSKATNDSLYTLYLQEFKRICIKLLGFRVYKSGFSSPSCRRKRNSTLIVHILGVSSTTLVLFHTLDICGGWLRQCLESNIWGNFSLSYILAAASRGALVNADHRHISFNRIWSGYWGIWTRLVTWIPTIVQI